MAKIAKSIRVEPNIYNYIDNYAGNGFNEKFENIITNAMIREKELKKKISELEIRVVELQEKKEKLYKEVQQYQTFEYKVNDLKAKISILVKND